MANFVPAGKADELKKKIDEAKNIIASTRLKKGLSRDELLSREARLERITNSVYRIVEEHSNREEVMLDLARKALAVEEKDED